MNRKLLIKDKLLPSHQHGCIRSDENVPNNFVLKNFVLNTISPKMLQGLAALIGARMLQNPCFVFPYGIASCWYGLY